MASINEKLTRVDESISNLKNKLKLDKNAQIEDIEKALTPKIGFTVEEWDEEGYATKINIYGISNIKNGMLNGASLFLSRVKHFSIPESVTSLSNGAFQNSCFETIDMGAFTGVPPMCFYSSRIKEFDFSNMKNIGKEAFAYCPNLKHISLPNKTMNLDIMCFQGSGIYSFSTGETVHPCYLYGNFNGQIAYCDNLIAAWLGSGTPKDLYTIFYRGKKKLAKIYINLPRATVETFDYYSQRWQYGGANTEVICNDDEGFISKAEFDAIDWSTYTE